MSVIVTEEARIRAMVREEVASAVAELVPSSDIMTREQVATMLHVDERTVDNYVKRYGLPGHKIGQQWRFVRTDVVNWLTKEGSHERR